MAPAPLSAAEELLVQALIRRGLVTADQVRQAQNMGRNTAATSASRSSS